MKKIAILGFGNEGRAVFDFLKKTGDLRNKDVWILDRSEKLKLPKGEQRPQSG